GPPVCYLCDPATGAVHKRFPCLPFKPPRDFRDHPGGCLAYSADGRELLCVSNEQGMRLVDLATLAARHSSQPWHSSSTRPTATLLPDGSLRVCYLAGSL